MLIVGKIEDVPVVDVLSMLHLSGRSGDLTLETAAGSARFTFRQGAITSASCPSLGRTIGQVLTERAGISSDTVGRALTLQNESKQPLGKILLELGVVTRPVLYDAVTALISEVVRETSQWVSGGFRFDVRTSPALDDVAFVPDEIALESGLGVKELLADALRVFSAHAVRHTRSLPAPSRLRSVEAPPRPSAASPLPPREPIEPAKQTPRTVLLVSEDGIVTNSLRMAWAEHGIQTRSFALEQDAAHQVAELLSAGDDVVTVLHTSGMGMRVDARSGVALARRFKAAFPNVPLVVVGGAEAETRHEMLHHGVRAVVPLPPRVSDPKGFRAALTLACAELTAIVRGAFRELTGSGSFVDGSTHDLKRLAERIEGLHRSTEHAGVALSLFEYVAENVERSVLFLCRKTDVIAVSAFGQTNGGEDMAIATPGLGLRLADAPMVRRVVQDGRSHRGAVSAAGSDCLQLFRRIGKPRSGAALWIPVRSHERVFALLYADNGARMRPLVSSEALQILALQAGLLLENMALKRRVQRPLEPRPESAA
jgi:hypothetical protein